jgi:high affinity sulfate transporter 1
LTGPAHRWAGRWWRRRGLASYRRSDLASDVGAGVMVTALLIPAGMGYATAAALPPETGLYATVAALVVYALVGPSRVLVLGPDSSLAPLIAAAVVPLAGAGAAGEERRVALAGVLALLVGAILVAAGALRLGFVSELLSKPIRLGYLSGVALVVVVGQIPALLGFSVDAEGLLPRAAAAARGIRDGEVVPAAAAIGVGSLALVVLLRRVAPRAPGLLIAVAAATGLVWALGLDSVPVVGALPTGVPASAWGSLAGADVVALVGPALGIAVVAFADTAVLSRSLATGPGSVDGSREMAALGAANVACGAAGGFPVSASTSRTPVAQASGAKTQVTGLVGAAAVALVVVLAPGLSRHLPSSVLAAVVIAAVLTIVDVPRIVRLARVDRREFGLAVLAFAGVAVLGVLWGVVAAVSLSLAAFVAKAWRPHVAQLVRIDGRKGYHDRARHPGGRHIPGLVMLRFDAPLFFANAELFAEVVHRSVAESPEPVRWVVVASEPITDIDTTAADVLEHLYDTLDAQGIRLVLAELKGPVKDRLARFGLGPRLRAGGVYPTLGTAVSAYVEATGVDWVDWTDRPDEDLTAATGGAGPPRPPDRRW